MSEAKQAFVETYLREIGVQTPVSLFLDGQKTGDDVVSPIENAVEVALQPESGSGPTLDDLAAEAAGCTACALAQGRNRVVFGVGNPHADLLFIGEAPGRDEDLKGEPFVGSAGQLLDRMLTAIGLDRSEIYIMNTIKCRPPNNRDPRPEEVQACNRWFEQQLQIIQPKLICLLGRVAAQTVLETQASLGSMRGRWQDYNGVPVLVTYHPAYLLRSPQQKQKSWHDLQMVKSRYSSLAQG